MIAGRVLYGDVADKAIGNPRPKGWIESGFNLLHNELGDTAGQKGRRYDLAPRRLEVAKARATELARAGEALPAELRMLLRLPFPEIGEAHKRISDALMRIAMHEDHSCEGFELVTRWRMMAGDASHTEAELLDLPEQVQAYVREAGEWTRRVESRIERWTRLGGPKCAVKIPESAIYPWLQTHVVCKVERHMIQFDLDGKTYRYFRAGDALLMEGAQYLGWLDPDYPEKLHLTIGDGDRAKYLGWIPQYRAVRRNDPEALAAASAAKARVLSAALREVNAADEALGGRAARDAAADANIATLAEGAALMGADIAASQASDSEDLAPVIVSMLDEQRAKDRAADVADSDPGEWTPKAISDLYRE